jgi:uncharacterized protein YjiS (DUF1127 family)
MSPITRANARTAQSSAWGRIKARLAEWQRRSQSRHELEFLSDSLLRDIGIKRCDARRESAKLFWMS